MAGQLENSICSESRIIDRQIRTDFNMGKEKEIPVYGEVCVRKIRRKRQRMLLTELFMEFSKNTTLHGLGYVTQTGLQIVEKIFWMSTFCISISLSFYFIYNVWYKWKTSPVLVSFSEQYLTIDMVPFPAVTICPKVKELKIPKSQTSNNESDVEALYKNYTAAYNNTEALGLTCGSRFLNPLLFKENVDATVVNKLYDLYLKPSDAIYFCKQYMRNPKNCGRNWIKQVLTKDGVCYNFNGLAADEIFRMENIQQEYNYTLMDIPSENWTLDGYLIKDNDVYPLRGLNSASPHHMELHLKIREDIKIELCELVYSGYEIYLHHPAEFPQSSSYYFAALPDQLSSMALKISVVTTSNNLRSYSPEIRQCYFPEDKWLKYFKLYSFNNCKLECLTNYTYARCNCVAFYMPYHNSSEICGPFKDTCLHKAEVTLSNNWLKCDCLPSCNYIDYDADIHKDDYPTRKRMRNKTKDTSKPKMAKVDLFFKDLILRPIRRVELFGMTDFLGQCGGLLGLFLGFSCLSLIEIFYFLTFRVYYTIKTDLKREREEGHQYHLQK